MEEFVDSFTADKFWRDSTWSSELFSLLVNSTVLGKVPEVPSLQRLTLPVLFPPVRSRVQQRSGETFRMLKDCSPPLLKVDVSAFPGRVDELRTVARSDSGKDTLLFLVEVRRQGSRTGEVAGVLRDKRLRECNCIHFILKGLSHDHEPNGFKVFAQWEYSLVFVSQLAA